MRKVLLSGITPSGTTGLHIGNYFGAIKQFVDLQDTYDSYIMVADMHALTTVHEKDQLRKNIFDVTAAYLACGLDPKKVKLFQQSEISVHGELTWIFNCITTMPYLERAVAYKDKVANGKEASVGLFDYPMLMAADILLYDPAVVPVGADQKQHVEFARDTALKFNRIWGETFIIPEPLILEDTGIVPGIDGRKMSKSYDNTIPLFASDSEIEKAVMSIVTDSSGEVPQNVYAIHRLLKTESELAPLYDSNKGKYKALKDALIEDLKLFIAPKRALYLELQANPHVVEKILMDGSALVKEQAHKKMMLIKEAVGLI
ncbi:MAG: tryptophan--tRNA ligase [Candidatus Pacebacteria bacterium]|nr:tryptophan--tRNA ligase [Candidatus Paceibacterota bacterium]